jgi:hypothetical protein
MDDKGNYKDLSNGTKEETKNGTKEETDKCHEEVVSDDDSMINHGPHENSNDEASEQRHRQ